MPHPNDASGLRAVVSVIDDLVWSLSDQIQLHSDLVAQPGGERT